MSSIVSPPPPACVSRTPSSPRKGRGNVNELLILASRRTTWRCRTSVPLPKAHGSTTKGKKSDGRGGTDRDKWLHWGHKQSQGGCVCVFACVLELIFGLKTISRISLWPEREEGGVDLSGLSNAFVHSYINDCFGALWLASWTLRTWWLEDVVSSLSFLIRQGEEKKKKKANCVFTIVTRFSFYITTVKWFSSAACPW